MKNTIEILVNGRPIKQNLHEGKFFVEARKGCKYEIKVKNNNYSRVLAVPSVDGLSVVSGKEAHSGSAGYIIPALSSVLIKGFRVSNQEVNLFEFANKKDSYAAKSPSGTKSDKNCGVISVRFIAEKVADYTYVPITVAPPHHWETTWKTNTAIFNNTYTKSAAATSASTYECHDGQASTETKTSARLLSNFDTGTKFSKEKVRDEVRVVDFQRGDELEEINIFYASRKALESMGVEFEHTSKISFPQGFKDGFCRPPE